MPGNLPKSDRKGLMNSRERVLIALKRGEPDRVPFCETSVSQTVVRAISGRSGDLSEKEISKLLGRDIVAFSCTPPFAAKVETTEHGQKYVVEGSIKKRGDLKHFSLPDPKDKTTIGKARAFIKEKEEFAAVAFIRLGISPVLNSMGLEAFSQAVYEDQPLVLELLERYAQWTISTVEWVQEVGFDLLWSFDDVAYKSGPFLSPAMFERVFLATLRKVTGRISLPWVFHSDGNILPLMDYLLTLGMSGIHPVEPDAMDIEFLKNNYGNRLCLVGNISVDNLARKLPEEIDREVRERIVKLAPGGGYMVSSSNSVPDYAKPTNVKAMADAVHKYGKYPIGVER